jgi:hypothetical protein
VCFIDRGAINPARTARGFADWAMGRVVERGRRFLARQRFDPVFGNVVTHSWCKDRNEHLAANLDDVLLPKYRVSIRSS